MRTTDASPAKSPAWTRRDMLLLAAGTALLVVAVAAVALKDDWMPLVGAKVTVPVPIALLPTSDFHALAFDSRDPNVIFFGHHNGVMKSTDGGVSWFPVLRQGDAMNLVARNNFVINAGHEIFTRSDDGGAMWKSIGTDLPDGDIHGFAVSPSNANLFFALVVKQGLWRSDNAGKNWALVSRELPDTVLALVVVPTNPETLYAGTMDKALLTSADGGRTWKPASGYGPKMAMGLAQDPRDARILYAATEKGLYRSDAERTSWSPIGLNGKDLMAVAVSPARPSRIMVVDGQGRVYRSDDGGSTWGRSGK